MEKSRGIVLGIGKPFRSYTTIFDYNHGRIDIFSEQSSKKFLRGALLSYTSFSARQHIKIRDVFIEEAPLLLARSDLIFIHSLLELVHYSFPATYKCSDTFELLWTILSIKASKISLNVQVTAFARLLFLIGYFDEKVALHIDIFDYLLSLNPRDILREQLSISSYQQLAIWVDACLAAHPHKDNFNVIGINSEAVRKKN